MTNKEVRTVKRVTAILLLVLLLLAGCGQSHVKTVTVNLTSYTVNTEKNTIFDGQNKYRYTVGGQGGAAIHTVYYPDGSSYYWIDRGGYSADEEGWSENYDPERYVSGSVLKTVLEKADAKRNVQVDVGRLIGGIACVAIGVVGIFFPTLGFYLRYGLYVENAEPTDFCLFMARVGGVACVVLGIVISIMAFT